MDPGLDRVLPFQSRISGREPAKLTAQALVTEAALTARQMISPVARSMMITAEARGDGPVCQQADANAYDTATLRADRACFQFLLGGGDQVAADGPCQLCP